MVTGNRDGSIRFWNGKDASPIGAPVGVHEPRLGHVFAINYRHDGAIVVSGSRDGTVALVDVRRRRPTGIQWSAHKGDVYVARYMQDGTLLTAGADGAVRLWNPRGPTLLAEIAAHEAAVYGVAIDPSETIAASVGEDGAAILWRREGTRLVGPRRLPRSLESMLRRPGARHAVVFSADGRRVATASHDHAVFVWNVATAEQVAGPFAHDDAVLGVAFHPSDPDQLISASWDGTLRAWPSGRVLAERLGPVYALAVSPSGDRFATAGWDFTVRLFDVSGQLLATRARTESPVPSGLSFSSDAASMAVAYRTGDVKIFDLATRVAHTTWNAHANATLLAAFSLDGARLATAGFDHRVRIWSLPGGELAGTLEGHTDVVRAAVFSPDGQTLASASRDTTVRLWDLTATGPWPRPYACCVDNDEPVRCVAYAPNGKLLATASRDGTARLWNPSTGEPIGKPLRGHTQVVRWVSFSPDGKLLATAGDDGTIRLWSAKGRRRGKPLVGHTDWVQCVAFSPDGKQLVSASGHPGDERAIRRWDVATGEQLGKPLRGHQAMLTWVGYSPDGRLLASASHDGTVRLWDAERGESLGTL